MTSQGPSIGSWIEELDPLTAVISAYYAERHQKTQIQIVQRVVKHFAKGDKAFDESAFLGFAEARGLPVADDRPSALVAFYADKHGRSEALILKRIIGHFTKRDRAFAHDGLVRFVEAAYLDTLEDDAERRAMLAALDKFLPAGIRRPGAVEKVPLDVKLCPFADGIRVPSRDARDLGALKTRYAAASKEADALSHADELGLYKAEFLSCTEGPKEGVFAEAGRSFEAVVRLSRRFGAGALALKVHDGQRTLHDFLFLTTTTILNDPVKLVEAAAGNTELADAHPLRQPYHSISAYSWGEGAAVKYRLSPKVPIDPSRQLDAPMLDAYRHLEGRAASEAEAAANLVAFWIAHAKEPMVWELAVQFAEDAELCPVDDAMVEWTTGFTKVAEVSLSMMDAGSVAEIDPRLRFNPYQVSAKSHLPLGRLNRFRRDVYRFVAENEAAPYFPYEAPMSMRVAVVGGGASGLASALALAEFGYAVTVFERNATLGGHACAKEVFEGKHLREPAFGAFRQRQWPNLAALLETIGVQSESHGVAEDWFDDGFVSWFARDGQAITRSEEVLKQGQKLIAEFTRAIRDPDADGETVGQALSRLGLTDEFVSTWFLGGVIHYFAGQSIDYYLSYPLRLLAWMWLNNAERDPDGKLELLRVDNTKYMAAFAAHLKSKGVQIRTESSPRVVSRSDDMISLSVAEDGFEASFHRLVLAVQPHHALTVLGDTARPPERGALELFEHTVDTVVVHQDASWLPPDAASQQLFNIVLPHGQGPWPAHADTVPITIAKPCTRDHKTPIYATYDYANAASNTFAGKVERFTFEHARVTPATQRIRKSLMTVQGQGGVFFCGSWIRGLTLHEDAIVSGFEAANRLMGAGRDYRVLHPPIALPEPFEQTTDADPQEEVSWDSRDAIVQDLKGILARVCDSVQMERVQEDSNLRAFGLSSLHFARLANAIASRLPDEIEDELELVELLQIETVGELADFIFGFLDEAGLLPEAEPEHEHETEVAQLTPPAMGAPKQVESLSREEARSTAAPPVMTQPSRREFLEGLDDHRQHERALAAPWVFCVQVFSVFMWLALVAVDVLCSVAVFQWADNAGGVGLAAPLAWVSFAGLYACAVCVVKWAVVGRLKPGRYPLYGATHLRWWVANLGLSLGQTFIFFPFRDTTLVPMLFRVLGGRVHQGATIRLGGLTPAFSLIDADLLRIDDRAYVRPGSLVQCHLFVDQSFVLAPVHLGRRSTLWNRAMVEPGATVGDDAVVAPHTVVTLGGVIPNGIRVTGVPAGQPQASAGNGVHRPATYPMAWLSTLLAVVGFPLVVAGLVCSIQFGLQACQQMFPESSWWSYALALWPVYVLSTMGLAIGFGLFKGLMVGRLKDGMPLEQVYGRLMVLEFGDAIMTRLSVFWTRDMRWFARRLMGGRLDYGVHCDPFFTDPVYGELMQVERGAFCSSAASMDFVASEHGTLVLREISVQKGAYVGAYATLVGPTQLGKDTLVASASHPSPSPDVRQRSVWVGAPAKHTKLKESSYAEGRDFSFWSRLIAWCVDTITVYLGVSLLGMAVGLVMSQPWLFEGEHMTGWLWSDVGQGILILGVGYLTVLLCFLGLVWLESLVLKLAIPGPETPASHGRLAFIWLTQNASVNHMRFLLMLLEPWVGSTVHRMCLRLLGVQIGKGAYIAHGVGFSELPLTQINEGAMINRGAALIGHSEQPDGTITFKPVEVQAGSTMGLWSYLVGGTVLPERTILGSLSRPFDGQELQSDAEYNNTPSKRRK